jgi:hypothetical protein
MRPRDTSPEAWKVQMDLIRAMPPDVRLQRTFEFSALVRSLAEAMLRVRHPGVTDREIFLRAARQRLGTDLFRKVYGEELADNGPVRSSA